MRVTQKQNISIICFTAVGTKMDLYCKPIFHRKDVRWITYRVYGSYSLAWKR